MTSALKISAAPAAALCLALLAACDAKGPPPPPPPPPPPAVSLSPRLIEQASAYRYYMNHATAITPDFADGDAIARSLKIGAAYEPAQLLRGAIAYGAVAALQDAEFVAGVRKYAVDATQRREITNQLIQNPNYVLGMTGAPNAAALAIAALGTEGQKLYDAGKAVKQSAYNIQHQKWSKSDVANRDLRLSQAKALSATPLVGDVAETARLQQAALGAESLGLTPSQANPPYTQVVARSLTVAALAALGEAGDANLDTVMAVMAEPNVASCINMSKLNLYQCLAVSKPHYEDVFCLGQHVMMDTGRCVIKASGLPEPYEPRFVPQVRVAGAETAPKAAAGKGGKKAASKKR